MTEDHGLARTAKLSTRPQDDGLLATTPDFVARRFSRRAFLGGSVATAATLASASLLSPAMALDNSQSVNLSLPGPTGPHRIGTTSLYLVDLSRQDPFVPTHPVRELMIQLWYPTPNGDEHHPASYMPDGAARHFAAVTLPQWVNQTVPAEPFLALQTHGRDSAPILRVDGGLPVVLFSPGYGLDRSSTTGLAEDLASSGFVVATIDHTHDSGEVEFPDGRVELNTIGLPSPSQLFELIQVRVADARFVLDQLEHLNAPGPFQNTLDLSRIGMFGHSAGGATTAETMLEDGRVKVGVNLDGTLAGTVVRTGLDRPFLLFGSDQHDSAQGATDPAWQQFWAHLGSWHQDIVLPTAGHLTMTDICLFGGPGEPFDAAGHVPPRAYAGTFGSINPLRAVAIERAYLFAMFDRFLRDGDGSPLDGPSPAFPEIRFEQP